MSKKQLSKNKPRPYAPEFVGRWSSWYGLVARRSNWRRSSSHRRKQSATGLRRPIVSQPSPHEARAVQTTPEPISKKHQSLSGMPAKISKRVGGKFTAWGSHLTGINLVLNPGKKIVQAWRATGWWPDHYSIAIFRYQQSARRLEAQVHPDRHPAKSIQWPLPGLDRDLLDPHEGNFCNRYDQ
jgi:hypothetical protein